MSESLPCVNCGKPRQQSFRKLCWHCTNIKRRYHTLDPQELEKARKKNKHECDFCNKKSVRVATAAMSGLPYNACELCWRAVDILKNPEKRAFFKAMTGLE